MKKMGLKFYRYFINEKDWIKADDMKFQNDLGIF